ncbi:hypothetical protein [Mycobacterium sp. IS-836]|nr:hypothetical protein [Mycobacterium sp. IS-836]
MSYLARYSVAIFAIASALFGLGMGASGIDQLAQYQHQHPEISI